MDENQKPVLDPTPLAPTDSPDIPPPPAPEPSAPTTPTPPTEEKSESDVPTGGDGAEVSTEDIEESNLPPVFTPPPKPNRTKLIASIAAILLLLVSIPTGIFLLGRAPGKQDIRELAAGPADCGSVGFKGWGEACDTGRGELVRVVICKDNRQLPNIPLGTPCGAGDSRSVAEVAQDQRINGCVERQCDTAIGRFVCIEEWRNAKTGKPYKKPGGITAETCTKAGTAPAPDTSKDIRINECKKEECDRNNFNPGHLICMEEWQKPNGDTYPKPGRDTKKLCGTEATANVSTTFSCTGGELDCTKTNCQGVSQPDCRATEGTVKACSDNVVRCCQSDGRCYGGTLQTGQTKGCKPNGNGSVTMVGFSPGTKVQVVRVDCPNQTSSTGECGGSPPSTEETIASSSHTFSANPGCGGHQVDVVGFCGSYAFNGSCETKAEESKPVTAAAPTGGPTFSSQCLNVKAFKGSTLLTADNFDEEVDPGDTLTLTVAGTTNEPGGINKARFRINGGSWNETTTKSAAGEFVYNFKVPSAGTFKFEAMVHNPLLGWR